MYQCGRRTAEQQRLTCSKPNKKVFLFVISTLEKFIPVRIKRAHDRRIQKTHNLLKGALVSLISEKPYDSIAVKEILDRANVGRSTFYMHFRDKDDLLVSGIHEMLHPIQSTTQAAIGTRRDRMLWFSLPIFQYHYQHRHAAGDRIGPRGRAILHDHLRRVLADVVAGSVKKNSRDRRKTSRTIPGDLLSEYVASSFVLVLNWWLEKGMPQSPAEINDMFHKLTAPTLSAVDE
jgi:AcrR family transcriptional regulator